MATTKVRKKPCPYCKKPLQAQTMLKWENNLDRHLDRGACVEYEAQKPLIMNATAHFLGGLVGLVGAMMAGNSPLLAAMRTPEDRKEIEELKKLYEK
jgi:hypothetical protein